MDFIQRVTGVAAAHYGTGCLLAAAAEIDPAIGDLDGARVARRLYQHVHMLARRGQSEPGRQPLSTLHKVVSGCAALAVRVEAPTADRLPCRLGRAGGR